VPYFVVLVPYFVVHAPYFVVLVPYFVVLVQYFVVHAPYFVVLVPYFVVLVQYFVVHEPYFVVHEPYFVVLVPYFVLHVPYFVVLVVQQTEGNCEMAKRSGTFVIIRVLRIFRIFKLSKHSQVGHDTTANAGRALKRWLKRWPIAILRRPWETVRFQLRLPVPGTHCRLSSEINSHWQPFDNN